MIKDNTDQTYAIFDEFVEEEMKSSSIYETDEDVDYEYWSSNHNSHAKLSTNNSPHSKFMNLLYLPEKYHISRESCPISKNSKGHSYHQHLIH
jgi:hypothetical protein